MQITIALKGIQGSADAPICHIHILTFSLEEPANHYDVPNNSDVNFQHSAKRADFKNDTCLI